MARVHPPLVTLLERCNVHYQGRAFARQRGGRLLAVVKTDGSITLHDLEKGVKPLFYNPPGSAHASISRGRLRMECESRSGEVLIVTGRPVFIHEVEVANPVSPIPRRRMEGIERDLVTWIHEDPSIVGLEDHDIPREVYRMGGRVDLQTEGVVVEVKKRADVRTFDQAQRYLRDPGVSEIRIACLHASTNLHALCDKEKCINLVMLDEEEFTGRVSHGSNG